MMSFVAALLPVLIYIAVVYALDHFALVSKGQLLLMVGMGVVTALACSVLFTFLDPLLPVKATEYLYPVLEESVKAIPLLALASRKKMVFFIDSIICGAAVGGGFSILENVFYLVYGEPMSVWTALYRGLEVALIHMGCSAIVAEARMFMVRILSRRRSGLSLKRSDHFVVAILFVAAPLLHILHNTLHINPLLQFFIVFGSLGGLLVWTYQYDANMIHRWLDRSLDKQVSLLQSIREGNLGDTPTGQYLMGVKDSFPPEVFFDIICYVQLNLELSVAAKARFMLKEAGLDRPLPSDEKMELLSKYVEYRILEKRLGRSARMSVAPVVKFYPADRKALTELLHHCR